MRLSRLAFAALLLPASATAQVMSPAEYVATAGASDLYERTSSQLVLRSTADPRIRAFAQMMIDHHTKSTADVKAAASEAQVPVPAPRFTPLQAELVEQLRREQGVARDRAYVAQQKAAHGQALNVHKAYGLEGTARPLKAVANAVVPVVQRHIDLLKGM